MAPVLVFLLALLSGVLGFDAAEWSPEELGRLRGTIPVGYIHLEPSRTKRRSNSEYASAQCVQACQLQTMSSIEDLIPDSQVMESLSSGSFLAILNVSTFQRFCEIYKSGKICLDRCENSTVKVTIMSLFAPVTKLCIDDYKKFLKHFPCFLGMRKEAQTKCEPKCGKENEIQARLSANLRAASSSKQSDMTDFRETMDETCRYMTCTSECQGPIVQEDCGTDAEELLVDFMTSTMRNFKDSFFGHKASKHWPQSCEQIAHPTHDAAPLPGPSLILSFFSITILFR